MFGTVGLSFGETKPVDEFHPHNTTRDGTRSNCRTCHNATRRGYDPPTRGVKARAKLATFDVANETWMDQAACRTKATDLEAVRANVNRFFPSKGAPPQVASLLGLPVAPLGVSRCQTPGHALNGHCGPS